VGFDVVGFLVVGLDVGFDVGFDVSAWSLRLLLCSEREEVK
jgi:hypothetical protein